jgi:hypothetical protein
VLEVVEHQQGRPFFARGARALRQVERSDICEPERLADGRRHERVIVNRRKRHEDDGRRTLSGNRVGKLQRKTCFAHASWPDERDKANRRVAEPPPQDPQIGVAPEKSRQRQRRGNARRRARGHERNARHRNQIVTDCARQIQRRAKRAHGFELRPAPLPALEGADRMHRQPGDGRQLLLREPRSLSERFELRTKRPRSGQRHKRSILPPRTSAVRPAYE